jgi:Uma2 family endonuclease
MATLVKISQIETLQGQSTILHDLDWDQYETILEDLGERRATRISYLSGLLEIEMPLPEHEKIKVLLGDLIKVLLEEMEIDFETYGSTTFKRQDRQSGLEPDDCFYIQNNVAMRGIRRLDLSIDPPPDLAIEVDVTSKTKLDIYQAIAVPELWLYTENSLKIYLLKDGNYYESEFSPIFGNLPIRVEIPNYIQQSFIVGRSATIRRFREWIRQLKAIAP